MGRPKKWQRFSKEENKIIGTFRDVDLKWDDVQDTTSILGEISEKIFKSNTVYHRRRVFERILSLQKKSSHIVSSKITSRKGRRYKRPFWAKRDSYELDQEDQRKQHEVKHEGKGTLRSGIDCDETSDSQRNQTQHEFHGIPKSSDEKSRTANTDQPKSFEDIFKTFLRRKSKENDEEKHRAGDLNENEQPQKADSEHNHESAREDQCKIPTEMTNKCTKMNATDSRQGYDENGDVNVRHRKKDAADKSLVKDQDDENNDKMHSTCYSNEQTNVCYSDDTIYDEDLVEEYGERFCFSAQKKEQKDRYSTDTSNVASAEQFETDEGIRERRMSLQSADESDIGYVYSKKDYAKDDSRFRDQQQDEKNEFTGNNKKHKEDGFSDSDFGASDKDFDIELKKGGKKGNDSGQMHGRGEYTYARVRNKNTKEESYTRAGKQNEKYFTADKKEVNNMYNTDSDKGVTDETKDVYSADKKMGKKRQNINGKDSVGSSDEINNSFVRAKRNYTNQKPMVRNQTNQHDKDKYGTADINERNGTCSDSDNDLGMNDDIDVKRKEVNKQQDFSFNISYSDEWKSIKPSRSESNKRKATLQHGWTDLLSKKFNEVIPGCVLAFRGHDLTAGIKSAYLSAVADCKHDDCGTFRFQIENKPKRNAENQVKVKVAIVRPYKPHTRETVKKRQLKGRRRRQMQEKLEREKASKLFYELLGQMELDQYRSGNDTECASKEVLKKAKSEWGLHDVLHQDPFTELCIVESILEDLDESSKHVSGYVQLICYKPFTTVLYTESSLEAAKEHIRVGGGVFNIDATGSVAYKVGQNKRRLLYYALVVNASAKFKDQVAVPVLEFFLEYQTTHNIANPLLMFFSALRKLTVFSQPVRIEVDFAWAIIHALLLSINLTSIIQYLSYCFRIVSGQCQPMSVTVIHICAAHMLKAFRDHIRDKVVDKGMRKFDIRVFALLQNITLLNESKQLWGLICTVLGSRTTTRHVQEKTITLQEMVKKASCDEMDIELTHSIDNSTDEESDLGRQMKGIRESSPFKRVFDNVRTQICPEEDENTPDNIYYQPDIVDIMAAQYMPLICLWSGLMLGDLQRHKEQSKSDVTRDTNAAVESWMNVVKNRTLGKEIPVRIGLFVREEYKVIKGRLREYLANASMLKAPSKTSKTPTRTKDNEKAEFAKETWQQRSEKKRKQTVYFSPTDKCPGPKEKKKATVQQEIHQASSNKDKKYLPQGFRNTDNICWLISSVQAMAAVSSLNLKASNDVNIATQRVINTIRQRVSDSVVFTALKGAIRRNLKDSLTIGRHEDAAEFVGYVLGLEPQMRIQVITTRTCLTCRKKKTTSETQAMLVTEIPPRNVVCVADCIKEYTKEEVIGVDDENLVECERCGKETRHLMKLDIITGTRDCIVIQLKRFSKTPKGSRKLLVPVHVDRLLTIGTIITNFYRLVAVQSHIGSSLSQGHYVSVVVSEEEDIINCDDLSVSIKSPSYLNSPFIQETCYLLYYQQIQIINPYQEEEPVRDPDQPAVITSLLSMASEEVVAVHHTMHITAGDLATLEDGQWINDEIVNSYMRMIRDVVPDIGIVDSFFVTAIETGRKAELFLTQDVLNKHEKVLIPVNRENHWSLVKAIRVPGEIMVKLSNLAQLGTEWRAIKVLDTRNKVLRTVDSRMERNTGALIVSQFLQKQISGPNDFVLQTAKKTPRQKNDNDCGVFMLQNAVCEAMEIRPSFTQHVESFTSAEAERRKRVEVEPNIRTVNDYISSYTFMKII